MTISFRIPKMVILLLVSCFAWIGIISLSFMLMEGMSVSAIWIVSANLFLSLVVWGVILTMGLPAAGSSEDNSGNNPPIAPDLDLPPAASLPLSAKGSAYPLLNRGRAVAMRSTFRLPHRAQSRIADKFWSSGLRTDP